MRAMVIGLWVMITKRVSVERGVSQLVSVDLAGAVKLREAS